MLMKKSYINAISSIDSNNLSLLSSDGISNEVPSEHDNNLSPSMTIVVIIMNHPPPLTITTEE